MKYSFSTNVKSVFMSPFIFSVNMGSCQVLSTDDKFLFFLLQKASVHLLMAFVFLVYNCITKI